MNFFLTAGPLKDYPNINIIRGDMWGEKCFNCVFKMIKAAIASSDKKSEQVPCYFPPLPLPLPLHMPIHTFHTELMERYNNASFWSLVLCKIYLVIFVCMNVCMWIAAIDVLKVQRREGVREDFDGVQFTVLSGVDTHHTVHNHIHSL